MPGPFSAMLSDGRSAAARAVSVELVAGGVRILGLDDMSVQQWPETDLRLIDDWLGPDAARLARLSDEAIRLSLRGPGVRAALIAHAPGLRRARHRTAWRTLGLVGVSMATIVALFALFWLALPLIARPLANLVPDRYLDRLGAAIERQVFDRMPACSSAPGKAALDRLTTRLVAAAPRAVDIKVRVIRRPVVNAIATPGGRIYVFSGLIDAAGSSDEIAGVLAHEIAHEVHRHGAEAAVRYIVVSSILSVVTGGETTIASAAAWLTEQLLQFAHSRQAEAEADLTGLQILAKAGVRSTGFAAFFARLEKSENLAGADKSAGAGPALPTYFRTHPPSAERRAAIERAGSSGGPAMSEADWQALRAVCRTPNG